MSTLHKTIVSWRRNQLETDAFVSLSGTRTHTILFLSSSSKINRPETKKEFYFPFIFKNYPAVCVWLDDLSLSFFLSLMDWILIVDYFLVDHRRKNHNPVADTNVDCRRGKKLIICSTRPHWAATTWLSDVVDAWRAPHRNNSQTSPTQETK